MHILITAYASPRPKKHVCQNYISNKITQSSRSQNNIINTHGLRRCVHILFRNAEHSGGNTVVQADDSIAVGPRAGGLYDSLYRCACTARTGYDRIGQGSVGQHRI